MIAYSEIRNGMGIVIKTHRLQNGISQLHLGERIGVSHQMVARYEKGRCFPSIPVLIKLANAVNATFEQLIKEAASPVRTESSKEEYNIVKLVKQLKTREKEMVYSWLKILTKEEQIA